MCSVCPEEAYSLKRFVDDWLSGNEKEEVFIKEFGTIMAFRHNRCELWILEDANWVLHDPGMYQHYCDQFMGEVK